MTQEENKDQDNIVKITVSKEAAAGLAELVSEVNSGFDAGRVHRQDLASWILLKFYKTRTDNDLHEIRREHFSEALMLEAMYRRMKETGEMPEFLRDAMRKHFQNPIEAPKKNHKALTKKYINDVREGIGDAA